MTHPSFAVGLARLRFLLNPSVKLQMLGHSAGSLLSYGLVASRLIVWEGKDSPLYPPSLP